MTWELAGRGIAGHVTRTIAAGRGVAREAVLRKSRYLRGNDPDPRAVHQIRVCEEMKKLNQSPEMPQEDYT